MSEGGREGEREGGGEGGREGGREGGGRKRGREDTELGKGERKGIEQKKKVGREGGREERMLYVHHEILALETAKLICIMQKLSMLTMAVSLVCILTHTKREGGRDCVLGEEGSTD